MYSVVALTVNNSCNMQCEHCYLNYDSPNTLISKEVLRHVVNRNFLRGIERVIVVGKEPLFNKMSRDLLSTLAQDLSEMGIPLEIITNGYSLIELDVSTARQLAAIDISLDGGPKTYNAYRGAATLGKHGDVYARIVRGIQHLDGAAPIAILHTLSSATTDVDDMMDLSAMNPGKILFSPFLMTPEVTNPSLRELSVESMMYLLASSGAFKDNPHAFFVLGTHSSRGKTRNELHELTKSYGLVGKVRWIGDSSEYVRISYDGVVVNSRTALSPSTYFQVGVDCRSLECIQDFKCAV